MAHCYKRIELNFDIAIDEVMDLMLTCGGKLAGMKPKPNKTTNGIEDREDMHYSKHDWVGMVRACIEQARGARHLVGIGPANEK